MPTIETSLPTTSSWCEESEDDADSNRQSQNPSPGSNSDIVSFEDDLTVDNSDSSEFGSEDDEELSGHSSGALRFDYGEVMHEYESEEPYYAVLVDYRERETIIRVIQIWHYQNEYYMLSRVGTRDLDFEDWKAFGDSHYSDALEKFMRNFHKSTGNQWEDRLSPPQEGKFNYLWDWEHELSRITRRIEKECERLRCRGTLPEDLRLRKRIAHMSNGPLKKMGSFNTMYIDSLSRTIKKRQISKLMDVN